MILSVLLRPYTAVHLTWSFSSLPSLACPFPPLAREGQFGQMGSPVLPAAPPTQLLLLSRGDGSRVLSSRTAHLPLCLALVHEEYGGLVLTHRQERRQSQISFFIFRAAATQLQPEAGSQPDV